MDQKSSFFICPRVSARFLHCFCTVSRDAMGTLTCKIRQRAQKLHSEKSRCFAQKLRKLETFKIRVFCPVGAFNQRARDSSSLERTKIPRRIVRFLVGFSIFWGSAHFCTLFAHRRESRVFPCIVCILCIVSRACRGKAPPSCWRKTVLSLKSSTGAFIAPLCCANANFALQNACWEITNPFKSAPSRRRLRDGIAE